MSGDLEDLGVRRRRTTTAGAEAFTAQVVRVAGGLSWVAELGDDTSQPIGPCRGPAGVDEGDVVLVVWTAQGPWVAQVAT